MFLAASQFLATHMIGQGYPRDRTTVHYLGVDTSVFVPRTRGFNVNDPLLFVGRLVRNKGLHELLAAMRILQGAGHRLPLRVIGDGPERKLLETYSRQHGLNVSFEGTRPPLEVAAAMRTARVLIAPSLPLPNGVSEGLNLTALEAQASGTPVVAYGTGGLPEAVAGDSTGLIARIGDTHALAAGIEQLATAEPLWNRMSVASVARVRRMFDASSQDRRLSELVTGLV
jgi:glycosyltransferase involved in cell wall biosynthesis